MSPRVAHFLPFPHVGGTELATLRIAEALKDSDFEHVVFCRSDAPAVRHLFAEQGYATYAWDAVAPSYLRPFPFLQNSWRLARVLRRAGVDLVHCADFDAAHYAAFAGRLARIPVLCHVRNRYPHVSLKDRPFIAPVDGYVFVSEETRRAFGLNVAADRATVVYDGIDVPPAMADERRQRLAAEIRCEFGLPPSARLVGMVARIAPQKDYETLIKAAAMLREDLPDLRFLLIGDYQHNEVNCRHYSKVREWLRLHGGADRFVFTGYRTDVERLIAALDVFVLSTHHEGLPLVLLEAMAQGIPVLATAVDGIPELVEDGKTGYLHAHGDAGTLARQLSEVVGNRERAGELGRAGRQLVERRFSREMFRAAVVDVYDSVLRRRTAVRRRNS